MEEDKIEEISISLINNKDVKVEKANKELIINSDTKEIKASDILELLDYTEEKKYVLNEIVGENELIKCVYEIFQEIINKINNIDNNEEEIIYDSGDDLPF